MARIINDTTLIKYLTEATSEIVKNEISAEELQIQAQQFLKSIKALDKIYQKRKLLSNIKEKLIKGTNDNLIYLYSKAKNEEILYVRSRYALTLYFDEYLTKFREELPKFLTYVTKEGKIYQLPLTTLPLFLNSKGRFFNPSNSMFLKIAQQKSLQNLNLLEKIDNKKHIEQAQAALKGVQARLKRYYEVYKPKSNQGGRLSWKEGENWREGYVLNNGDVKEAYVQALLTEHKDNLELCQNPRGNPDYYSHELIGYFFKNYIIKVDSGMAINKEDVYSNYYQAQYAVKSSGATAPGIQQYIDIAKEIVNGDFLKRNLTKENLTAFIENQDKMSIRNKIIENEVNEKIQEVLKQIHQDFEIK